MRPADPPHHRPLVLEPLLSAVRAFHPGTLASASRFLKLMTTEHLLWPAETMLPMWVAVRSPSRLDYRSRPAPADRLRHNPSGNISIQPPTKPENRYLSSQTSSMRQPL